MIFKKTTLSNGLRVVTAPMPSMESATVQILIGAGSRDEAKPIEGLAHFLEHMVFKGTKRYPTAQDISAAVDGIGGEINASTGKERTAYYIKAWERYLVLAFDILSEFIKAPVLSPKEIEKEKGVILEEIAMYEDLPMHKAPYLFEELIFSDTNLEHDILGSAKTVKAAKGVDFKKFMADFYRPENMVLSVAGKFEESQVLGLAEKYFGQLSVLGSQLSDTSRSVVSRSDKQNLTQTDQQKTGKPEAENRKQKTDTRIRLLNRKTEQAHLVLGVYGNPLGHPDRYKEAIIASILGGGMSSWLWSEVREKRGLAYYVRCDVDHYKDTGYVAARAGVRLDKVEEAIKVILDQFAKISTPGKISQAELAKAKEYLKGRLALGLEDTHSVSEFFGDQELFEDNVRTVEEVMAEIDKVEMSDVLSVARGFFQNKQFRLAVVGPYKDEQKFKKLLNF